MNEGQANGAGSDEPKKQGSKLDEFSNYIDAKTGTLKFAGKATVHNQGIEFTTGKSFSISL